MKVRRMQDVIKNLKDLIVVALVIGVLTLLGVIIVGDYYVALQENRPVDESVITLMKMALTGLIGIIAGYVGAK
jgi:hypothetical protein